MLPPLDVMVVGGALKFVGLRCSQKRLVSPTSRSSVRKSRNLVGWSALNGLNCQPPNFFAPTCDGTWRPHVSDSEMECVRCDRSWGNEITGTSCVAIRYGRCDNAWWHGTSCMWGSHAKTFTAILHCTSRLVVEELCGGANIDNRLLESNR